MKKLSIVLGVVLLLIVLLVVFGERMGFDLRGYAPGLGNSSELSEEVASEESETAGTISSQKPCGESAAEACNGYCEQGLQCVTPAFETEPGCWCGVPCKQDGDCAGSDKECLNGICFATNTRECGDTAPLCNGKCPGGQLCKVFENSLEPGDPGCVCIDEDAVEPDVEAGAEVEVEGNAGSVPEYNLGDGGM